MKPNIGEFDKPVSLYALLGKGIKALKHKDKKDEANEMADRVFDSKCKNINEAEEIIKEYVEYKVK